MPGTEAVRQKILLISDDINGRAVTKSMLEQHDATVLIAENWQQCITSSRFIRPDLILVDIADVEFFEGGMPAICRTLKEQEETRDIPLIVAVGQGESDDKAEILKAGADDVIARPFHGEELSARVRVHLENRSLVKLLETKGPYRQDTNRSARLLSDLSHDIRTPLGAIIGFTELLQQDCSLSADNRVKVDTIRRSGTRLSSLINDLVAICRLEAGRNTLNLTSFDLYAFARDIERMIEQRIDGKPCRMNADVKDNAVRYIVTDRERLASVIVNLVEHAAKASPGNGINVTLRTRREGGCCTLTGEISDRSDNMTGTAPHVKPARSEGKEAKGSHYGLIMGRELLRFMGGSVEVESNSEGSERIRFALDVKEGPAQPAETRVSHRSLIDGDSTGPLRVLVVDDAVENCIVFTGILEHLGFDVRSVENGRDAVRQYEEWRPHIIMMDLRMPGMDGFEAARMIRAKDGGGDAVIFAATGDVLDSDKEKIRQSGMDGYVLKPYEEQAIREKIGEFVKISAAGEKKDGERTRKESFSRIGPVPELPDALVERMQDAAKNARLDILLGIADEVEAYDRGLAEKLRQAIKIYDYESIFEILEVKE